MRVFAKSGVKSVLIAGMDGYSSKVNGDYFSQQLEYDYSKQAGIRNKLISRELREIQKTINIEFITPTYYSMQLE